MLLRELTQKFKTFTGRVKVPYETGSQWIEIKISAINKQSAQRLLKAQYGAKSIVGPLREH